MVRTNEYRPDGSSFIKHLEKQFRNINQLLYTTSVPCKDLEEKVMPYIADDVVFKDPWQEGGNKQMYSIGMKGFHNLMRFTFDINQIGIQLNGDEDDATGGKCIVDGIMNLKQFDFIYTFPLRTIVVYDFRLIPGAGESMPFFEIFRQEEMWSYTELIDGIPGVGWVYKNLFRPAFGHLFVGVSYLSCLAYDNLKGDKSEKRTKEMNE